MIYIYIVTYMNHTFSGPYSSSKRYFSGTWALGILSYMLYIYIYGDMHEPYTRQAAVDEAGEISMKAFVTRDKPQSAGG